MAEETVAQQASAERGACPLANVTKTAPQYGAITPRWLVRLLDWKPLGSGIFRPNRADGSKPIRSVLQRLSHRVSPTSQMRRGARTA